VENLRISTQSVFQATTRPRDRAAAGGVSGALEGATVFSRVRVRAVGRVGVGERAGRLDRAFGLCDSSRVFGAQSLPDRSARTVHPLKRRDEYRSRVWLTPKRAAIRDGGSGLQRIHLGFSRAALVSRSGLAVEQLLAAVRGSFSTFYLWLPCCQSLADPERGTA